MTGKLTIDKAGRIVLPKPLREELQLQPGDSLEVNSSRDEITLRPLRGGSPLKKKCGVWVFHTGEPLSGAVVEKTVRDIRREREEQVLVKKR
ncbi:MAG: AbrB/MazE/SpoVT family DNA-binding domain-containing protein [Candidatus Acidiferrales bacterium]